MKITTAICKQLIVDWTQVNQRKLSYQYGGDGEACDNALALGEDDNWSKVWNTKNWSRTCKRKTLETENYPEGAILREFNCTPFDDTLRAYVCTDKYDYNIIEIRVQRE